MRFVTFAEGSRERAGVLTDESTVLDLANPLCESALDGTAPDLLAIIERGLPDVVSRISALEGVDDATFEIGDVTLMAPLPRPPRIIGVAHNYRCALNERGLEPPAEPVLFEKLAETVIGPGEAVRLPKGAGGCTYEAELAVVIGPRANAISQEDAIDHIAGYTIVNDVSASEIIRQDGNFKRGKNFPTFGPMGPFLATPDEIDPISGVTVTLDIGADRLQSGTTADLCFGIAALIVRLSRAAPLEPGTVIATGTPAGVAAVQTPPTWLVAGTTMTASVSGLGKLSNPVINEADADAT